MNVRTIYPSGEMTYQNFNARDVTLEFLQSQVGGLIESVLVPPDMASVCVVFCNEDGIALGLPFNSDGTKWVHVMWEDSPDALEVIPWLNLCGPVVIVTGTPEEIAKL